MFSSSDTILLSLEPVFSFMICKVTEYCQNKRRIAVILIEKKSARPLRLHLHLLSRNRPGWRMSLGFLTISLMPCHTGWPMVPKPDFRIRAYCSWGGTCQRRSSRSRPS